MPLALVLALSGCAVPRSRPAPTPPPPVQTPSIAVPPATPAPPAKAVLEPGTFADLPGWSADDVVAGWQAFLQGCPSLRTQPQWATVCDEGRDAGAAGESELRRFIESRFVPHRVLPANATSDGLLTGYYEPLLRGNRTPDDRNRHPLFGVPDDLITVDLSAVVPDSKNLRLKGRLSGRRLVPYWSRAEIDKGKAPLAGKELLWVDDPIDLFFLQIQGSGRVQLPSGELVRVGYADQNGHPYRSIGRLLVERGELSVSAASMQGIKAWALANPDKLGALLDENPSYVFFRELPRGDGGPPGSMGVPLTPGRSIAVDPSSVPMGAPVFLDSIVPGGTAPLQRLVAAQDTGGAIKGAVRADFFWGFGDEAGAMAGRMRQPLRLWVLLPKP